MSIISIAKDIVFDVLKQTAIVAKCETTKNSVNLCLGFKLGNYFEVSGRVKIKDDFTLIEFKYNNSVYRKHLKSIDELLGLRALIIFIKAIIIGDKHAEKIIESACLSDKEYKKLKRARKEALVEVKENEKRRKERKERLKAKLIATKKSKNQISKTHYGNFYVVGLGV